MYQVVWCYGLVRRVILSLSGGIVLTRRVILSLDGGIVLTRRLVLFFSFGMAVFSTLVVSFCLWMAVSSCPLRSVWKSAVFFLIESVLFCQARSTSLTLIVDTSRTFLQTKHMVSLAVLLALTNQSRCWQKCAPCPASSEFFCLVFARNLTPAFELVNYLAISWICACDFLDLREIWVLPFCGKARAGMPFSRSGFLTCNGQEYVLKIIWVQRQNFDFVSFWPQEREDGISWSWACYLLLLRMKLERRE